MKTNLDRRFYPGLFLTLGAVAVLCFLLLHAQGLYGWFSTVFGSLKPVFMGAAVAYVLVPLEKWIERLLRKGKLKRFSRLIASLLTLLLAIVLVALFCAMVLPQLTESVSSLLADLPQMLSAQMEKLEAFLASDDEAAAGLLEALESVETHVAEWVKDNLLTTVTSVAGTVKNIGSALINLIVALVVTVYLLLDRERYLAQCKKLFFAVSRNERFNQAVLDGVHQANRIFSGFISGKLLDSLIVGIICFVVMALLRMPYALLISVIVGITNVIPMFGPIIGAVPGVFLLLMVSPMQALEFLIFVFILQQVDGNIIGPKILGDSTGLSALYVTVAILLFGKLWGFMGMLVGVPVFATLYYIIKRLAEGSLKKQGLPTETRDYQQELPATAAAVEKT